MIGYTTVGTNDLERATQFYDALFSDLGAKRVIETDRLVAWGSGKGPSFGVVIPFNKEEATPGNGNMVALAMQSEEQVKHFYSKALELGATCEGKPGVRVDKFYIAYFRDLDGNKLNFFCVLNQE